jgi:hypothetical protein
MPMTARHILIALGLAVTGAAALPTALSAAPSGYDDPLPRVEGRLCPGIAGMRTDAALQMVDRIRETAGKFGITLADPDVCEPNLLVYFVNDAEATLNSLMDRQPALFSTLTQAERRDLKSGNDAVRVWSQIVTRSRDGMTIDDPDNLVQIPRTAMWAAHSKIYVPVRREILTTVVLFDNQAVVGKSLTQLADYAAMRALANDFSAYPQDRSSILGLFENTSAPGELTQTDRVFLETLYTGIPNLPGRVKERNLTDALDRKGGE